MKQISSLLAAVVLLCGVGTANGQESEEVHLFKATKIKAEQGDAEAQSLLGAMYNEGKGVLKNYAEAAKWFRKAAEQGNDWAQNNLGNMYDKGMGVPKNYEEAVKWFRKAAEQGLVVAQGVLGLMYAKGEGVPQDVVEAYAWFLLLKANGIEEFSKMVSTFEKNATAEQREKGQARAAELRRLIEQKEQKSATIVPERWIW